MRYERIGERRSLQAWIRPASASRVVANADSGDAAVQQWLKPITERGQPAGDGRAQDGRFVLTAAPMSPGRTPPAPSLCARPAGVRPPAHRGRRRGAGKVQARALRARYRLLRADLHPCRPKAGLRSGLGVWLDPGNFYRKIQGTRDFVIAIGPTRKAETGRPARLFRAGPGTVLHPPMLRSNSQLHPDPKHKKMTCIRPAP